MINTSAARSGTWIKKIMVIISCFLPFLTTAATLADNRPCVVYVHGGSWTGGSPTEIEPHRALFSDVDIVTVDYRLIPKTTITGQIKEVAEAIRTAKKTHSRVYVMGYSAGGQLAVMAARLEKVDGVIAVCAPLDFKKVPAMKIIRVMLTAVNPIAKARQDKTPTLLIHGDADEKVPIEAARSYLGKKPSGTCQLITISGAPHRIGLIKQAASLIKRWINE